MDKIKVFTDLVAWQKGHSLVLSVYQTTKIFPNIERFGLVTQMQRSSCSITSNIAEGFGRRTEKEKVRFCDIAIGSLYELQSQLYIARDLNYLKSEKFKEIYNHSQDV